jgi:hypothetical protein
VQLYTLQYVGVTDPDMLRAPSTPHRCRRWFQSGPLRESGGGRADHAREPVARRAERRDCYREVQRLIAGDVPYVSLWAKTNVAVSRADLDGVTLSPIAEFSFLRHVRRTH